MAEVASAYVTLIPSARGFGSKLDSQIGRDVSASGRKSGGLFSSAFSRVAAVGVGVGIVGGLKSAIGLEAEFSKTMNVIKATTGESGESMKRLSDLALRMGADTVFSANDASRAMLELARGGISSASIEAGALEGTLTLAAAGELDMATAANVAVKSMGQFGLKGKAMNKVAAALAGAANASSASVGDMAAALAQGGLAADSVGFTVQETTGILAAFSNAGLEGSDAGTSLKTALDRLQPVTKAQTNAFKDLGIITEDGKNRFIAANGEFKSAADIAQILKEGTTDLSDAERKRLITLGFGSDAQRAATILAKEGAKGIEKMVEATSNQKAAQKQANAVMKGTAGAVEKFKGSVETATLKLGLFFAPAVQAGLGFLSDAIDGVPDALGRVKDAVKPAFRTLKNAVQPAIDTITDGLKDLVKDAKRVVKFIGGIDFSNLDSKQVGEFIGKAFAEGLDRIVALAGTVTKTLGTMLGKVDWVGLGIAIGKQVPALLVGLAAGILNFDLGGLLAGLGAHWGDILLAVLAIAFAPAKLAGGLAKILVKIPFVGTFLSRAVVWLNELGGKLAKFGGDALGYFWRGLTAGRTPGAAIVSKIMSGFKAVPGRVKDFFDTLRIRLGVYALEGAEAVGRGFRGGFVAVIRFIAGIPGKILTAIGNVSRLLFPKGTAVIEGLWAGLKSIVGSVLRWHMELPGRILRALGAVGKLLYSAGQDIIRGLINGIKSMAGAAADAAISVVKGALDKAKSFLKIKSPSRVWEEVGNWSMRGLADGIEKGGEEVQKKLKNQLDRLKDQMSGLKDKAKSLAESVASAFTVDAFGVTGTDAVFGEDGTLITPATTALQDFMATLSGNVNNLKAMNVALDKIKGFGASDSFLKALFESGNSALVLQLAAGGPDAVTQAQDLFSTQNSLSNQLGSDVAQQVLGDEIRGVRDEIKELRKDIKQAGKDNADRFAGAINGAASTAVRSSGKRGRWQSAWA